jgi:hypothetical protein
MVSQPARTPSPAPVIFALLLVVMLGAAIAYMGFTKDDDKGAGSASGPKHELNVFYTLEDKNAFEGTGQGTPCKGKDAYADLNTGAKITFKDETGKTMTTGGLPQGQVANDVCVWHFVVHNLPEMASYSFEVGNRGVNALPLKDLQDKNWTTQASAVKKP